jgi:hypothetical protein
VEVRVLSSAFSQSPRKHGGFSRVKRFCPRRRRRDRGPNWGPILRDDDAAQRATLEPAYRRCGPSTYRRIASLVAAQDRCSGRQRAHGPRIPPGCHATQHLEATPGRRRNRADARPREGAARHAHPAGAAVSGMLHSALASTVATGPHPGGSSGSSTCLSTCHRGARRPRASSPRPAARPRPRRPRNAASAIRDPGECAPPIASCTVSCSTTCTDTAGKSPAADRRRRPRPPSADGPGQHVAPPLTTDPRDVARRAKRQRAMGKGARQRLTSDDERDGVATA